MTLLRGYCALWRTALVGDHVCDRTMAKVLILALHAAVIGCLIVGLWLGARLR